MGLLITNIHKILTRFSYLNEFEKKKLPDGLGLLYWESSKQSKLWLKYLGIYQGWKKEGIVKFWRKIYSALLLRSLLIHALVRSQFIVSI